MKTLIAFTHRRLKRLNKLLNQFPAGNEKEELHQIRLEIKKIKAVLRLISFNNKKFKDHKHYIPFRTIFRETGKIRDKSLRIELLEQYTGLHTPFYRSPSKALNQFVEKIPKHQKILHKEYKVIHHEIKKIQSSTYTEYLRRKHKELDHCLSKKITNPDLHFLRKKIKEIIYLTQVKTKKKNIDSFLTRADTLIGNWHDKMVLIPWIRVRAPKEISTIRQLQSDSRSERKQLGLLISQHQSFH